ncbi:MAG: nucleoside monophosphate kinase [Planctomycetota bacterium]
MHKYVIMGKQGSGKGTQAVRLAQAFDLTHISVGDIFRWNIQSHTKLGAKVKRTIAEGRLVHDDTVAEIVNQRLQEHDWNYGFILDGFPRNSAQAEFFLESYDVDAVVHLDIPDEVVIDRVMGRRICSQCGLDYHLMFHRPKVDGVCDVCGGSLVARADDNEQALRARLHDFNTKTRPTLDLFERKELVVTVDGTASPDAVFADLCDRLGLTHPAAALAAAE